ncbi:glycerol-3-phosphate dehydrogenase/oxidase [Anoxybacillus sp. D401a]|uniref:glycerol-3-phosphate dehydrogenase/oxidase n=1 Tax=Anoxybacillus sp. D401a TaxID=575112 RepID=UPI003D32D8EE
MFSAKQRMEVVNEMSKTTYDVLVIGGGITGCGIALDAVTRGMKTALIEMQDFAAGTSSRSTKLVHGGLRYLKQFEVKMVADVGKERAIVYENGPHVTTPEWMLLPIHRGGTFGKWSTSIGLWLYDRLARVKKEERRTMLSAHETLQKEPLIKRDGLLGGGYYVEYRTDDARLTIEVIKKAVECGAHAVNYVQAESFLYDEHGRVIGVMCREQMTNESFAVYAKKIVNAAGPWVDTLREKDGSNVGKKLRLTKGVHIVIDQAHFPLKQAVYFDTPDGRMVFAIPREGKTYIGTTDTFYDGDRVHPKMTSEDRDYLLRAIRYMFPSVHLTEQHIESSWAGLRPLIYEEGKDPSEISRKDEVWQSPSGLITIAGGKLTGYRKMAETVVDLIAKQLEKTYRPCQTKQLPISGGDIGGANEWHTFIAEKVTEGMSLGFTEEQAKRLIQRYGTNVDRLFALARTYDRNSAFLPIDWYVMCMYALEYEMAVTPLDFFIRRTGALFFDIHAVRQWKGAVTQLMQSYFNWTDEKRNEYEHQVDIALHDAITPCDEAKH